MINKYLKNTIVGINWLDGTIFKHYMADLLYYVKLETVMGTMVVHFQICIFDFKLHVDYLRQPHSLKIVDSLVSTWSNNDKDILWKLSMNKEKLTLIK